MGTNDIWIIADLDGTLANVQHRLHCIQGPFPDWHAFNWASKGDMPYWTVVIALRRLQGHDHQTFVSILTGREECCRQMTEEWFQRNNIFYDELLMRPTGDHRSDREYKLEMYQKHFTAHNRRVWLVLEDRDKIVELWRSLGLTCFQTREGDY